MFGLYRKLDAQGLRWMARSMIEEMTGEARLDARSGDWREVVKWAAVWRVGNGVGCRVGFERERKGRVAHICAFWASMFARYVHTLLERCDTGRDPLKTRLIEALHVRSLGE
jgi:putative component of toxin-antitoxin plasmid stabilization module